MNAQWIWVNNIEFTGHSSNLEYEKQVEGSYMGRSQKSKHKQVGLKTLVSFLTILIILAALVVTLILTVFKKPVDYEMVFDEALSSFTADNIIYTFADYNDYKVLRTNGKLQFKGHPRYTFYFGSNGRILRDDWHLDNSNNYSSSYTYIYELEDSYEGCSGLFFDKEGWPELTDETLMEAEWVCAPVDKYDQVTLKRDYMTADMIISSTFVEKVKYNGEEFYQYIVEIDEKDYYKTVGIMYTLLILSPEKGVEFSDTSMKVLISPKTKRINYIETAFKAKIDSTNVLDSDIIIEYKYGIPEEIVFPEDYDALHLEF